MFDPRRLVDDAADRRDIAGLVWLLAHARPEVRASAARELERLGGPHSTVDLVPALDDESGQMRRSAARALGAVGGTAAVEPLVSKMLSDADHAERWQAAASLGRIGDRRALTPLVEALDDRRIRGAAIDALAELGGPDARGALQELRPPRWRPYLRMQVRQALDEMERTDGPPARAPRTPLVRTSTALVVRLVAIAVNSGCVAALAVLLFNADATLVALVAGAAFLLLLPWHLLRKRVEDTASEWVRSADQLASDDAPIEHPARTVARIHLDTLAGLPLDIGLVAIGALLTYPEVAAGIVAGSPGFVRFASTAIWVRRWERRNGSILVREATGSDERRRRFVLPENGVQQPAREDSNL